MRKILLATTALVAFAGAAQAAEAPIQVKAGGYVDFRAALFQESETYNDGRTHGDFATEYGVQLAADAKANDIEYGAFISISNSLDQDQTTASSGYNEVALDEAYIWMSGDFGKVILGDERGASDLFVMAPTVGEGQYNGSYTYFTDRGDLGQFQPALINLDERSTKITYYTPKVGNADHKVQLGVSYMPDMNVMEYSEATGNHVDLYKSNIRKYRDVFEATLRYEGKIEDVDVTITPFYTHGDGVWRYRSAAVYGLGGQASYKGVTLGGSYVNAGHWGTEKTRNDRRNQAAYTFGASYAFDNVELAANYLTGEGYIRIPAYSGDLSYVDSFKALGLGATYTWFPGLTTAADVVFFDQNLANWSYASNNIGHVFMISQKMAF